MTESLSDHGERINREILIEALRMYQKYARRNQEFFKADRAQYLINKVVGAVKSKNNEQ